MSLTIFLGDDVRVWKIAGVFEGFVLEPEDVEVAAVVL